MKMQITGASNFVNRMFEACGRFQWARELLRNSLEAGASTWSSASSGRLSRTLGSTGEP